MKRRHQQSDWQSVTVVDRTRGRGAPVHTGRFYQKLFVQITHKDRLSNLDSAFHFLPKQITKSVAAITSKRINLWREILEDCWGEVQRVESLCRLEICGDFARTKLQYVQYKLWRTLHSLQCTVYDVITGLPTTSYNRKIQTSSLYNWGWADFRPHKASDLDTSCVLLFDIL